MKLNTQGFNPKRSSLGHSESRSQNQRQENFESRKKGKGSSQTGNPQKAINKFLSRSLAVQKENGIFKATKKKSVNQVYFTQQSCPSEMKDRKRLSPEIIKKLLTELKTKVDSSEIIVGDFSTALSTTNRSSRQKINMKIKYLN